MEIEVKYTNLIDRDIKAKEQEAKGLTMKHDNFDADWKTGGEPHGTMVFTDVQPLTLPPPPDYKAEWQAADTPAKKLDVLARALGLE